MSCSAAYPGEVDSRMVYGPFSLAEESAAEMVFDWWSDTGTGDEFFFGASTDDYPYHGIHVTKDHSSWTTGETLDLGAVPSVGCLLREVQVWIGF